VRSVVSLLVVLGLSPAVDAEENWALVRSAHFQVYSQTGEHDARALALWLERLRAFAVLASTVIPGHAPEVTRPIRIVEFRSQNDYSPFRLRSTADAYFVGGVEQDYIVLPRSGSKDLSLTAHEYAHAVFHSLGLHAPPWLAEGLAEIFSTVRIGEPACYLGDDLPGRTSVLREARWMPLDQLLAVTGNSDLWGKRSEAEMFYSESWALTSLLLFSPGYREHAQKLWDAAAAGTLDIGTLARIYGKSPAVILTDLRGWVEHPKVTLSFPGVATMAQSVVAANLSPFESRLLIADLLFNSNDLARSEQIYMTLAKEQPQNPTVAAALGNIALRRSDGLRAQEQWRRAIELGIADAQLCYRYARMAEDAGLPQDDVAAALQRAIEVQPHFDEARFELGLLEGNRGNYRAALEQFLAMDSVPAKKEYGYWMAVATAYTETDQREQAKQAAAKAAVYAQTDEQKESAFRIRYFAATDLTVQLSHDANGELQVVTARKRHGSSDWNPFVEPNDDIRMVTGKIRRVECKGKQVSGFQIETSSSTIAIALTDPTRVLMSGGVAEFVCDAEDGRKVAIQYAASNKVTSTAGVLRGMQFQP
jgi:tetratricopeptide (TPR) repeat protein